MEGVGASKDAEADTSTARDAAAEIQPCAISEPECNVTPPDIIDRDATELQSWPLEKAPTKPEPDAGFHLHFGHWVRGFSLNARVAPTASRDHLANERTFLGWVRTSLSLAITGTVIAQLFRIQHNALTRPFGFYRLGIPLASICHGAALLTVLVGAHRFRMQQKAMIDGKIKAGGWEPWFVGAMVTMVLIALFALVLAADIEKELG